MSFWDRPKIQGADARVGFGRWADSFNSHPETVRRSTMGGAKRFSVSEACERLTFKDVYLDVRRFILMFP